VAARVDEARRAGEPIDYLTFVSDGEPTLDAHLGVAIDLLRPIDIPIAVISNGSLFWRSDVRETLKRADWVSLKVDSVDETVWRRINRPHGNLDLSEILDGMLAFSTTYRGVLASETMLVKGLNVEDAGVRALAEFLHKLKPRTAYLSIPTRPPAERDVCAPEEAQLNRVYQLVNQRIPHVQYLTGYEGNAFATTGDATEDLLSITAVHPMREEAVRELLARTGSDWRLVEGLIEDGKLRACQHEGQTFYVRRFRRGQFGED
jgi:wyosine [tRNA(Phe)-imidazoG37] synthetase (radical SAM superfamily)